jgi:hypothetical protein
VATDPTRAGSHGVIPLFCLKFFPQPVDKYKQVATLAENAKLNVKKGAQDFKMALLTREEFYKELGEALRKDREKLGLSPAALAERLNQDPIDRERPLRMIHCNQRHGRPHTESKKD